MLVLGANGQLGKALRSTFPLATFMGRSECDLASEKSLLALPLFEFDVVINAAAFTAVDPAETREGEAAAFEINTKAV